MVVVWLGGGGLRDWAEDEGGGGGGTGCVGVCSCSEEEGGDVHAAAFNLLQSVTITTCALWRAQPTAIISGVHPSMLQPLTFTPFVASAPRTPSALPLAQALSSAAKESVSSNTMLRGWLVGGWGLGVGGRGHGGRTRFFEA